MLLVSLMTWVTYWWASRIISSILIMLNVSGLLTLYYKFLMTEVMLEESLSAACFLNDLGDLLVGFKNHIFYIDHAKCKWFINLISPRKPKL